MFPYCGSITRHCCSEEGERALWRWRSAEKKRCDVELGLVLGKWSAMVSHCSLWPKGLWLFYANDSSQWKSTLLLMKITSHETAQSISKQFQIQSDRHQSCNFDGHFGSSPRNSNYPPQSFNNTHSYDSYANFSEGNGPQYDSLSIITPYYPMPQDLTGPKLGFPHFVSRILTKK